MAFSTGRTCPSRPRLWIWGEHPNPEVFEFQYSDGPADQGVLSPEILRDDGHPDQKFGNLRIGKFQEGMVDEFKRILSLMNEKAPGGKCRQQRDIEKRSSEISCVSPESSAVI